MKMEVANRLNNDCAVQRTRGAPNGSWVRLVIANTFARLASLSESICSWACDAPIESACFWGSPVT